MYLSHTTLDVIRCYILLKAEASSVYRNCTMTMRTLLGNRSGKNIVSTEDYDKTQHMIST